MSGWRTTPNGTLVRESLDAPTIDRDRPPSSGARGIFDDDTSDDALDAEPSRPPNVAGADYARESSWKSATVRSESERDDDDRDDVANRAHISERATREVDVVDLLDDDDDDDDDDDFDDFDDFGDDIPRVNVRTDRHAVGGSKAVVSDDDGDRWRAAEARTNAREVETRRPAPANKSVDELKRMLAQELEDMRAAASSNDRAKSANVAVAMTYGTTTSEHGARSTAVANAARATGSMKTAFDEITAVLDESLNTDEGFGKAIKNAFEAATCDQKPILYAFEKLPMKSSVTWRFHQASQTPVGGAHWSSESRVDDRGAHSAEYTAVLMRAGEFVELLENDHSKLRALVKNFKSVNREPNHKLCVVVQGFHQYCVARERKEAYAGPKAFKQRDFDHSMAIIFAQYENVIVVNLPKMESLIAHVVTLHKNLAVLRYEPPKTLVEIVGSKTSTRFDNGLPSKTKTSSDVFFAALTKIPGVSEAVSRLIVQRHRTMKRLMDIYEDPMKTEAEKKVLLADLLRTEDPAGTSKGQPRAVGPVVSERVYNFFKPRAPDDRGDASFARH